MQSQRPAVPIIRFAALCILVLIAVSANAYSTADFLTPPEWLAHGLGNSGGVGKGGSIEPINLVVSAQSNVNPLVVLQKLASFGSCFGSVSTLQANVQPGQKSRVGQFIGLRDGGCAQIFVPGNHLRAWHQTLPNGRIAMFFAASEEHPCRSDGGRKGIPGKIPNWHCIDPNGFNNGRDSLTRVFNAAAKKKRSGFTVFHTERAQLYSSGVGTDAGAGSSIDHIPYDGKVDILVLKFVIALFI